MKKYMNKWLVITITVFAWAMVGSTARADLSVSNDTNTASWDLMADQGPFYASGVPTSFTTGQGQPGANSGAASTALSETFTITNGAGSLAIGNTNYVLTGIAVLASGGSGVVSVHLYDVTANLTSNNGSTLNALARARHIVTPPQAGSKLCNCDYLV